MKTKPRDFHLRAAFRLPSLLPPRNPNPCARLAKVQHSHRRLCCFLRRPPPSMPPTRTRDHTDGSPDNTDGSQLLSVVPLTPEELWFDDVDVIQSIGKDIRSHYLEPCTCWRNAPDEHKDFWWRAFKASCTWPENLNHRVHKEWKTAASKRLRDMVWKALHEDITEWMPNELKQRVKALRETNAFKKISEQNKKNKTTGPKAGTLHTSGSISASQWARRLTKQNQGKRPTASQIFKKLHTKKEGADKVFCDNRSKAVWEEYERLKAQASESGTEVDDDELFLQAVGGKNKKGTVYGLGTESEAYYSRSGRLGSSSSSYTPSVVSQMETRLKKSEEDLQATREELRATREEQRHQREFIASLLARLEGPSSSHSIAPPS